MTTAEKLPTLSMPNKQNDDYTTKQRHVLPKVPNDDVIQKTYTQDTL